MRVEIATIREALRLFADDDAKGLLLFIGENQDAILNDFAAAWQAGWALRRVDLLAEASRFLEKAVLLRPDKANGPFALAVVKAQLGERLIAEAENLYRKSMCVTENWGARQALAVLLLDHGRGSEGEQLLREGVEAKPQSRVRHEELASYLEDRGKLGEAEAVRSKASNLPPRASKLSQE